MQTRREYLADKGLAIANSRGKFSKAAIEELNRAIAAGIQFSDAFKVNASRPNKTTGAVDNSDQFPEYICPSDFRFPESEYKAIELGGDGVYSVREACNTCRVSLTNHLCNTPSVYGKPVRIVAR